ncbi:ABC transporter permease [Phenylobacterium sp.]|uniref:ABC transporter permease n=1 Tax=Phenylobacterium sp. TaxID=1871053 RepID=UPI0035B2DA67
MTALAVEDTPGARGAGKSLRRRLALFALLAAPGAFVAIMGLVPAGLLIQLSFAHRVEGGLWSPGFELTQYAQVASPLLMRVMAFSLTLALCTAAIVVSIAFPAAYFISRMRRRGQVAWLIYLLSTLSLSEVLIVFSFQVLLSTSGSLAKTLTALGLLAEGQSLYPNFAAVLACLVYLVLPYVILFFYPAVSRIDEEIEQAAATMGASRFHTFMTVVLPMMRGTILAGVLLVVIFTVGSYLTPLVLGKPQTWTVAIHISNAAMQAANLPLAAAEAVAVVVVMIALLILSRWLTRNEAAA